MRIAKPRAASASTATVSAPRRRRGIPFSPAIFLGTLLHLMLPILDLGSRRRSERRDVACRLKHRRRERQRQRDGHCRTFANLALHRDLAAMQTDQAFDDRQPEAGAFMA